MRGGHWQTTMAGDVGRDESTARCGDRLECSNGVTGVCFYAQGSLPVGIDELTAPTMGRRIIKNQKLILIFWEFKLEVAECVPTNPSLDTPQKEDGLGFPRRPRPRANAGGGALRRRILDRLPGRARRFGARSPSILGSLSGPLAIFGTGNLAGATIAFEEANATGGVNGTSNGCRSTMNRRRLKQSPLTSAWLNRSKYSLFSDPRLARSGKRWFRRSRA